MFGVANGVFFLNGQNVTKTAEEASNIERDQLSCLLAKVEDHVREKLVKKESAMLSDVHVSRSLYNVVKI